MKLFFSAFALLTLIATAQAGEYDRRVAEDYAARKAAAGASAVASYAEYSGRTRDLIVNYIARRGGSPEGASCATSTGYSCDGSLCTPFIRSSLSLLELGAPGHLFRSCDFSIGNDACKVIPSECTFRDYGDETRACDRAALRVSCIDDQRRTSGDFIYAAGAERASVPKAGRARRSR